MRDNQCDYSLLWLSLWVQPSPFREVFLHIRIAPCRPSLAHSTWIDHRPPEVSCLTELGLKTAPLPVYFLPLSHHQEQPCPVTGLQTLRAPWTSDYLPQCIWAVSIRFKVEIQKIKSDSRAKVFKMKENRFWWKATRWKPFQILISILLLASCS